MTCRVQSWMSLLFAVTVFGLLTSCATVVEFGRKPDVNALEQSLQISESTRDDVRRVLGEPFGNGQSLYPWDDQPRETWIYYYDQATTKESHRLVLFVYFYQEKFGGYMWWSSLPEESQAKATSGGRDHATVPRVAMAR
jgi:hypothetical protein